RVGGRPTGRFCRRRRRVGGRPTGRFCRRRRRVGGRPTGRFWRLSLSWTSDRDPGRLEVLARRFPPDSGLLLDPAQRPAKPPQRQYRLLLFFAQDVHSRRGTTSRRFSSTSWRRRYDWPVFRCPSLAGFGCPPREKRAGPPEGQAATLRVRDLLPQDRRAYHFFALISLSTSIARRCSASILLSLAFSDSSCLSRLASSALMPPKRFRQA